jgi:hypothetical protein
MSRSSANRWLVWIPVLMVASLLYWTVALGLGGLSLMAVSALSGATVVEDAEGAPDPTVTDTVPGTADPIVVHLEESSEPEDVNDNVGAGYSAPLEDASAVSTPVTF